MSWPTPAAPSGVGAGVVTTSAAYDALVAAEELVPGTSYFIPELPAMWGAWSTSEAYGMAFDYNGNSYVGDELVAAQTELDLAAGTWATRPTSDPGAAGTTFYRRMTDIGTAPGGTVMAWLAGTSTEWHLTAPLRLRLRGAGATGTSAQYPTNTRHTLPTGLLAAAARFDANLKFDQADETTTLASWRLKLGSTGTATDATIAAPTGTPMSAGDNQRAYPMSFNIESATSILADAISNAAAVGWQTSAVNSAADAAVSLTGSDDTGDALYLGVDYTLGGGGGVALTTTLILTLWP